MADFPGRALMRPLLRALLCLAVLLAGCRGWDPEKDPKVYKDTYRLTNDGHYRVRRGDTLHAIAFNFGMDWRDIAALNNIRAPYTIYPDQELRMSAPAGGSRTSASKAASSTSGRTSSATSSGGAVVKAAPPPGGSSTTEYKEPPRTAATASPAPGKWLWPIEGRVVSNFKANDPARNGIDIAAKEGQSVRATAAGEVVYSGSGLIAYGELIIIKHNESLLSAYAHNRKRLVSEGQRVKAGESIAELGRNDRNQAMLHFEIRRDGTPQDPLKYLPRR